MDPCGLPSLSIARKRATWAWAAIGASLRGCGGLAKLMVTFVEVSTLLSPTDGTLPAMSTKEQDFRMGE